ncbi:lys-63-specific deubiquitinase BRCC36 isoform X2 [Aplysia californica]|uniref:Lys-63-specific deubiquitinase BRCC36 isoform X1 n=1 Tax=Aplysia californica TaxID=6500 RepID=A0ABM0JDY1_APLCA|nr:lys-63-specific deubiquitinase BRCC36 isoform X1 [Aplysia californica]XP_005091458.1 lys-63-specific deubiquitinase BRCC36 isoform X2 [Aplysia californica]
MSLKCVNLESDVYLVCLTHALSTEREEIMGLLIGEVDEERALHISSVVILRRSDKQPDRVEISPEQQSDASIKAEQLAKELNRPLRVVGWYHSHPHITVWPSHVDLRTQASYQQMDDGFVGLIFSVFNEDKVSKFNKIQVTCFQSRQINSEFHRAEVPLNVVPTCQIGPACLSSLVELPKILLQEEDEAYARVSDPADQDLLTRVHNASVFTKSLCHVMEVVSGPLLHSLEQRLQANKQRTAHLQEEKAQLEARLKALEQKSDRHQPKSLMDCS